MAKTKEAESTKVTEATELANVFDPNSMAGVLAEYGITEGDFYVPPAPTVVTAGFEEICTETSQILDDHGNVIVCEGHTLPLMFLGKTAERDSNEYKGYDGYYQFAVWHPTKGKTLLSHSRAIGEEQSTIVTFLKTLRTGAVFEVAQIKTRAGFKVFNPVPVQK
jgi:hypothetical protein